eukprot:GHRR01029999.1.p1 GENE.GHRR01029999.1~~GHRR01029999.1.p1  ORF type:complete len:106 (-),score=17.56 GHRR01029999.1:283-600(-)
MYGVQLKLKRGIGGMAVIWLWVITLKVSAAATLEFCCQPARALPYAASIVICMCIAYCVCLTLVVRNSLIAGGYASLPDAVTAWYNEVSQDRVSGFTWKMLQTDT